jgi:hypothetical protein
MKKYLKLLLGIQIIFFAFACNKENMNATGATNTTSNANGAQAFNIYLTDGPIWNDTVNLDIKLVEAKLDTSMHKGDDHFGDNDADSLNDLKHNDQFGHWDTLNFTPNIYNVAALRNGIDKLLATANIKGTLRKVRITLGTNNTIIDSGITYPLINKSKYVYADIHANHHQKDSVNQAAQALWLDFDLFRSIKKINGSYYLLPFLKPFSNENFASVQGTVLPIDAKPTITIYNTTDTSYGLPNKAGFYKIRGIVQGTYSINFKASNGYKDTTINNLVLTNGKLTTINSITLHK